MRVFGPKPWGNWTERMIVGAPVGQPCFFCEEPILEDDLGVFMPSAHAARYEDVRDTPWHRDCVIYSIFARPEDERPTKRASATAARERLDKAGPP